MNIQEIKSKAWESISKYNNMSDEDFNTSATTFKISDEYNLAIWCDLESDNEEIERYYIVSIRHNPYNDLFGEDIGAEWCTKDISQEELNRTIDIVLNHKSVNIKQN